MRSKQRRWGRLARSLCILWLGAVLAPTVPKLNAQVIETPIIIEGPQLPDSVSRSVGPYVTTFEEDSLPRRINGPPGSLMVIQRADGTDTTLKVPDKPVDVVGRVNLEAFTNGAIQATAQAVRIRLGEPGGFSVPLYLFVGATEGGAADTNETAVVSLLSPLGGNANLSFIDALRLVGNPTQYTGLFAAYQVAGKVYSGTNMEDEGGTDGLVTAAGNLNLGLQFKTRAWREDNPKNVGVFWAQAKGTASFGPSDHFRQLYGPDAESWYWGYSAEMGLQIPNLVNLQIGVYEILNPGDSALLQDKYIKFAVSYEGG